MWFSQFLNRENLTLKKLPCFLVRDGVLHLEHRVAILLDDQFPNIVRIQSLMYHTLHTRKDEEGSEYVHKQ